MKKISKAAIGLLILTCTSNLVAQKAKQEIVYSETSKLIKPTLFADLGETCTTPDGMALDKKGNLYLSVTNPTSFEKFGSKILVFDKNDKPITWFDQLPLHPLTQRVHPMGMEFGPDGNLYVVDNQCFAGKTNISRLIRVIVKEGKPINAEVLVEGFNFSDGLRWSKNRIYITDASLNWDTESAIYSFSLDELNKSKIILNAENKQQYVLSTFTLKPGTAKHSLGIDGIAFDKEGNLYGGSFGDGVITKIEFSEDGKVKSKKVVFSSDQLKCSDGFFYDEKRNSIFIANYDYNSVHQLNLNTNTLSLIWKNENADGADGQLDNPCETIIYKGKLLVVNYDTFKGIKNTEIDSFHTISSFDLEGLK